MTVTFEEIWEKEFAPIVAEQRRVDAEQRTEALLDYPLELCGESVRQMTPHDVLVLDALGNPFIAGGQVEAIDCAGFVWQLHAANTRNASLGNLWRRGKFIRRFSRQLEAPEALAVVARAIARYVDRMLLDDKASEKPEGEKKDDPFKPEPKTHFIVPLLLNVAAEIGHVDPLSGDLLAHVPLPRLMQYQRAALDQKDENKVYTEMDSLRNRCMDRVNQINLAARASA